MKQQQGYALVIVLLIIVLFLGISATFIAGTMNHAKQEVTVDTTNQSVAAAEMGVLYYTEDFERSLQLLQEEIVIEIQQRLDSIARCGQTCNSTLLKTQLDEEMKRKYTQKVKERVTHMDVNDTLYLKNASADGKMNYTVVSAQAIEKTGEIEIVLNLKGKAKQGDAMKESALSVKFNVHIPSSFLTTSNYITYDDVYRATPTLSCNDLLIGERYKTAGNPPGVPPYECKLGDTQKLSELITKINSSPNPFNPQDFRVYTDKYLDNVCNPSGGSSNCNSNDFQGISVVVNSTADTLTGNMNGLTNFKLYVSGKLIVDGNLNGLDRNVMVLKELVARNNIQNIEKTTLVVLGYEGRNDASFEWSNNISMKSNARICVDIDRIKQTDLTNLSNQLTIDASSSLIYYTSTLEPNRKTFSLAHSNSNRRVQPEYNYSNFLNMCGITISGSHTVPNITDTGFDFDVIY
ncbi:hypothetical protein [Planococcus shixiaomingii]|nr:hypothetical protein [Planococcus sp. N028]